jgi:hypothetical protein
MKTIKQAATERANSLCFPKNKEGFRIMIHQAFCSGVAFAQRWISVDEELPKKNLPIIFKTERGSTHCGFYAECEFFTEDYQKFHMKDITHWRPIKLK